MYPHQISVPLAELGFSDILWCHFFNYSSVIYEQKNINIMSIELDDFLQTEKTHVNLYQIWKTIWLYLKL